MTQTTRHQLNGAALQAIRVAQGLQRHELATIVGIDPSYLYKIEIGRHRPRETVIRALATALDVPLAAITQSAQRVA